MKKLLFIFCLCLVTVIAKATTGQYTVSQVAQLQTDLAAGAYDIYELTSSGGNYQFSSTVYNSIVISKTIKIQAQTGLAVKPTISISNSYNSTSTPTIFYPNTANISITLDGIEFNGINGYPSTLQNVLIYGGTSSTNLQVIVRNCFIHNFLNAAGSGTFRLDGTGSSIDIQGSTFDNCSGRVILLQTATASPYTLYGDITLKNNTFNNIQNASGTITGAIIFFRTASSGTQLAIGANTTIDHCTFNNYTGADGLFNFRSMSGNINFTNSIFKSIALGFTFTNPNASAPIRIIDNCYLAGFATPPASITSKQTVSNIVATAPTYNTSDIANLNFTLTNSPQLTSSADSKTIGNTIYYPTPASATNVSSTGFTANWTAPSMGTATSYGTNTYTYTLEYSTDNTFASGVISVASLSSNTLSYSISGLFGGTTYYYRVKVAYNGTSTNYSGVQSVTTSAIPQLTSPTANTPNPITASGFTASWASISNAISYNVNVYQSGSLVGNVHNTSSTSIAISGLSASTNYTYSVTAIGDGTNYSNSSASTAISFSTIAFTQLSLPTSLSTTPITTTGFTATWTAGDAHASSFDVKVYTYPAGVQVGSTSNVSSSTTSLAVSGLTANTAYTFTVTAKGDGSIYSDSSPAASSNFSTLALTKLSTPTATAATLYTATAFTANWTTVANASSYTVVINQGSSVFCTTTGINQSTSSLVISGLTAGLSYTYTVTAKGDNVSSYSDSDPSTSPSTYTSSTPALLTAFDINSTGFTAYWIPTTNATGYSVNVYQGGDLITTLPASGQTASSAIITGLKTGLAYTYTVTGSDNFTSASSSTITTQTPTILETFSDWATVSTAAVINFSKTLNDGTTGNFYSPSIVVSPSNSINAPGSATGNARPSVGRLQLSATGAYLQLPQLNNISSIAVKTYGNAVGNSIKIQSSTDNSTFTDVTGTTSIVSNTATMANTINLNFNTPKYIRIVSNQGSSSYFYDLQVNPYISATKLASSTVGTASAIIATGFTANWSTVTNAIGYYVRVYQGATLVNTAYVAGQASNSLAITGLTTNLTYTYKVIAQGDVTTYSSSDASSASGSISVSNPLTTPTIGVASLVLAESFTANWTAVSNASTYTVKVYDTTPAIIKTVTVSGQSSNSINITGLSVNSTYTFTVTANGDGTTYNDSGESQKSSGFTTSTTYPATINTNFGDGTWGTVYTSGTAPALGSYPVYSINGWLLTHAFIQSGTSSGGLKGEVHTNSLRLDKTSNSAVLYSPVVASVAQIEIHSNATTGRQLVVEVSSNGGSYSTVGTITASGAEQIDIFTVSATNAKFRFTNTSTGQYVIYQIITRTTAPALLSAPTVGTASGITSTGFTAIWTPVDANATGYKVFVYNGSTLVNSYTSADGQAISSLAITGLTANTTYTYKVLSRGDNDVNYSDSYLSSSASFTTLLSTPSIGTASAITTSGFTANWTAVTSASGYDVNIYQGTSLISTTNASGQATVSLIISGLSSNTAYTYKVIAKGNGTSTYNSVESTASASFSTTSTASSDYFRSKVTGNWSDAITWESSSNNTNWGNASSAPGSSASAISILNGHAVSITANLMLTSLTINTGGILNLNAGKQLTVSTTLTNNGTINLLSDASGTATIITPTTITGSGTVNVQQYLPVVRNWYMSSPVSGATGLPTVDSGTLTFYSYPESDANQSSTGAYWNTVSSGTMMAGTGYIVKPSTASTITFSGTSLNTGDITISGLTNSTTNNPLKHGFNLIGNPYPSYLNVLTVLSGNSNLETTVWYRTRDTNTTPLYHFETVNATSGVGTDAGGTGGRATGYIPPMQAFWVRTHLDNQSITLLNSNRSHAKTDVSMTDFPNTPTTSLKAPSMKESNYSLLGLNISNGSYGDETILMFDPSASNGLDAYDSGKMSNSNINIPELFTVVEGSQLAINGMSNIPYDTEIPLGFTTGLAGTFTIKASQISNFDSSINIYLKDNDNLLNTPVQLNSDAVYSFSSTVTTNNTSRFALIFKAPSIATGLNSTDDSNVWISTNANNQIVVNGGNSVEVYNAVGQKLAVKNLITTTTVLETPLQSGVYFVTLGNGIKSLTRKVIIK